MTTEAPPPLMSASEDEPPPFGTMTEALTQQAGGVGRWARITGVASATAGAVMLLGVALLEWAARSTPEVTSAGIRRIELTYLVLAVTSVVSGAILSRFGTLMNTASRQRRAAPLVQALEWQHRYWMMAFAVLVLSAAAFVATRGIATYRVALLHSQGRETMRDLAVVGRGLEQYAIEHHEYPAAKSIDELATKLEPTYITTMPRKDGWGRPFDYAPLCRYDRCGEYRLGSTGEDGAYTRPLEQISDSVGEMYDLGDATKDAADFVHGNGHFLIVPVAQRKFIE